MALPALSERTFGVEIECGIPRHPDRTEYSYGRAIELFRNFEECGTWYVSSDGSGVEVQSPPLEGKEGLLALGRAFQLLIDDEAYVSASDGMHVHHGAEDYKRNPAKIIQLVRIWMANQDKINLLVSPMRRDYGACPNWRPKDFNTLLRQAKALSPDAQFDGYIGRKNLNVTAIGKHGTIEFRGHEGCLDLQTAADWIAFGQKFLDTTMAAEEDLPTVADPIEFIRALGASNALARRLEGKLSTVKDLPLWSAIADAHHPSHEVVGNVGY